MSSNRVACNSDLSLSSYCSYHPGNRNPWMHSCALDNIDTLRHILTIFGRTKDGDQ